MKWKNGQWKSRLDGRAASGRLGAVAVTCLVSILQAPKAWPPVQVTRPGLVRLLAATPLSRLPPTVATTKQTTTASLEAVIEVAEVVLTHLMRTGATTYVVVRALGQNGVFT